MKILMKMTDALLRWDFINTQLVMVSAADYWVRRDGLFFGFPSFKF